MCKARVFGLTLIASIVGLSMFGVSAQTPPKQVALPLSLPQAAYYSQHPQELQQQVERLSQAAQQFAPGKPLAPGATPSAGTWTTLTNSPGVAVQNPLLMTDGTVIATSACTGNWYKLTPDNTGSYVNGTWTQIASLPSGYAPLFFGSGVLPDGRVIVEGGEYNGSGGSCGSEAWTTKGAIYDPVANTWTSVNPPSGWTTVGDAAGIVLDNGTYMQSDCCNTSSLSGLSALLNPNTLTWTPTGSGKLDRWDEEGMAKLQNGNVLVVDAHTNTSCSPNTSEIYNASTGAFSATGNTVDQEADCSNPANSLSYELGPVLTRQDGSAVVFPGVLCSDLANTNCANQAGGFVVIGHADLYNVGAGTWSTLATMPRIGTAPNNYYYSLADAPAAVLPDGNVLFAASPDYQAFVNPTHYFEMSFSSPGTITQVGDTTDAPNGGAFAQNFLLLPTGQVLAVSQLGNIQIYTPLAGNPQAGWGPVITLVPSCVSPGGTYSAAGTQLNGLTEGSYYGDDVQSAVNFPVVRIVNNSTSHVFYAKTFNHSTRSIAPGATVSTAFTVANATETGPSTLYDVGAGIPSVGTPITVRSTCASPLADTHDFNDDGKSDIAWRNTNGDVAIWLMNGTQVLSSPDIGNVPTSWSIVGQRQLNNSGYADLIWRNTNGDVAIWLMNGTQVLSASDIGNVPTSWSIAGTSAYNATNGYAELIWRNTGSDVAIWQMNGTQVLSASDIGNVPTSWSIVGTGDFSGTGNTDILWLDTAGDVAIWFMNGTQVVSASVLGNVPTSWTIVGTGDFNGDGKTDILWRNANGDVAIWLMNGTQAISAPDLGNVPANWTIAETGDFNGDGYSDILWRDAAGDVAIWFMNGTQVVSAPGIGNVPPSWTIQGANAD